MQRAAVSIPSNIAEGHTRSSFKKFLQFLSISLSFLAELETHLTIAGKLKYLDQDRTENILGQTNLLGKRIRCLQQSLQNKAA
jgi:four helix bundle protein